MTSEPSASPEKPPRVTSSTPGELPKAGPPKPGPTQPGPAQPGSSPEAKATGPAPAPLPESAVTFTKAAALWSSLLVGFLILIVLLIFVAQNTESAEFAFLGWRWSLPRGVALLAAAVGGGLLTVAAGTVRIVQLRRAAKKNLQAGL